MIAFSKKKKKPEGLNNVGGWCGSSIKVRFPGKGDGSSSNISDLRLRWGTRDQVWVSRSVWLDGNSKFYMLTRSKTRRK